MTLLLLTVPRPKRRAWDSALPLETGGKMFVYEIYEGAGHTFMRRGETVDTTDANRRARDAAWQR